MIIISHQIENINKESQIIKKEPNLNSGVGKDNLKIIFLEELSSISELTEEKKSVNLKISQLWSRKKKERTKMNRA